MQASRDESIPELDEKMTPDASPGEVSKSGVRRVNNMPIILIGVVGGLFLIVMLIVALQRSAQQNAPVQQETAIAKGSSEALAKEIAGSAQTGIVPPAMPVAGNDGLAPEQPGAKAEGSANSSVAAGKSIEIPVTRPGSYDAPPAPLTPPGNPGIAGSGGRDDMDRLRQNKLQIFEEAIKSRPVNQGFKQAAGSSGFASGSKDLKNRNDVLAEMEAVQAQIAAAGNQDPTAAYQSGLQRVKETLASGGGAGGGAPNLFNSAKAAPSDGYSRFDKKSIGDRWHLNSEPEAPETPYVLRAGYVIPGIMLSGINSDLPGQIMAQVGQNVYDTATGKYLIIPQGTRLLGAYSSDVAYGQSRVLVAWQRLIFPDGKAMDLGSMPGADGGGYSGFADKVNTHFWKVFSSAFLMSGIVAGVTLSQSDSSGDPSSLSTKQRASDAMSQALGQQLGQAMSQMLMKNLNVAPTIEIRPGYRFNVMVSKDLTFKKPYQSFDY